MANTVIELFWKRNPLPPIDWTNVLNRRGYNQNQAELRQKMVKHEPAGKIGEMKQVERPVRDIS